MADADAKTDVSFTAEQIAYRAIRVHIRPADGPAFGAIFQLRDDAQTVDLLDSGGDVHATIEVEVLTNALYAQSWRQHL
jgi:hypothetical protein